MQTESLTEFSGVAGRVLQRSVSMGSLITGILVGFTLIVGNWVLLMAEAPNAVAFFNQIVIAFALARFVVNGYFGEWSGTVFSAAGGPWSQVGIVALRYLSLTAVWLVPLVVLGLRVEQAADLGPALMFGATKLMMFATLYFLLMTLTPPLFLIVSVTAEDFGQVFTPDHWKRQFTGRLADLFVVYVVYTGTLGMVLILSVAPAMMAFNTNVWLGVLVAVLSFCLLFGVSVNLLGRLCGFFACGDLDPIAAVGQPTERTGSDQEPSGGHEAPSPIEPAEDSGIGLPVAVAVAEASVETEAEPNTAIEAEADDVEPAPRPPARRVNTPEPTTEPEVSLRLDATPEAMAEHERKTPLLDAQQRVEAAMKRFKLDPSYTLSTLSEMHNNFAPSPHVMQALTICLSRTGHIDAASKIGDQALEICLERGLTFLAADIFKEMRSRVDRLPLSPEQILTIASALVKKGDLAVAAKAYSTVIGSDPKEVRAVKGLLGVADQILQHRHKPEAAIKVYTFLLEHCSSSPLAEYIHSGLEEAQRKLEQPIAAGSAAD